MPVRGLATAEELSRKLGVNQMIIQLRNATDALEVASILAVEAEQHLLAEAFSDRAGMQVVAELHGEFSEVAGMIHQELRRADRDLFDLRARLYAFLNHLSRAEALLSLDGEGA